MNTPDRSSANAWQPDTAGWLPACTRSPSPNHDARPADTAIELLVIHAISLPPGEFGGTAVLDFFNNRLVPDAHPYFSAIAAVRVSAHFFIRRNGQVVQCVSCHERAWHAGASCWRGRGRCNDFSLGIELEGDDAHAFTDAQYGALLPLLDGLRHAYPIREVLGHHDIAPARKTDPGSHFDWQRIAAFTRAGAA